MANLLTIPTAALVTVRNTGEVEVDREAGTGRFERVRELCAALNRQDAAAAERQA
jgi:hypothetical protein